MAVLPKFTNMFKRNSKAPSSLTKDSFIQNIGIYKPKGVNNSNNLLAIFKEQKGKVLKSRKKGFKQKGESHPFDFKTATEIYKNFSMASAVIDKTVDFTVGRGFNVVSEDPRAEELVRQFLRDVNFDNILRQFLRDSLITGNGFIEIVGAKGKTPEGLIVKNPEYFFIETDDEGELEQYWQILPNTGQEPTDFKKFEIAHLPMNKISDSPYGIGIICPNFDMIESYINNTLERNLLLKRKANSPIHVKLGNAQTGQMPTQDAVDSYGQKLEWLRNNHEWCTDANVDMKVLDFGNVGDKFNSALEEDMTMLIYGFQMPEAIMGKGNISEGLGKINMETLQRRIFSIQTQAEKVIENQIFRRVVQANGLNAHVEMIWGTPTEEDKRQEIDKITELLKNPFLATKLRVELEKRLSDLMELNVAEDIEVEREKEKDQPLPVVPGSNNPKAVPAQPKENLDEKHSEHLTCRCHTKENFLDEAIKIDDLDLTVKEWVEFDYTEYQDEIQSFLSSKDFESRQYTGFKFVPGTNQQEWIEQEIRYKLSDSLSEGQVGKLRKTLKLGFKEGQSIREISNNILNEVKPEELKVKVPDVTDDNGKLIRKGYEFKVQPNTRSVMMARTETVRAANQGALKQYKNHGIEEVSWVSSPSERTCEFCIAQQGKVMKLSEAQEMIPAHISCRCTWIPKIV